MTLFEIVFGLTAVILGLALTLLASNLHRLMMAGRRVRWAPEPLILCGIIFLVIVTVWLGQWGLRGVTKITEAEVILKVLKMLSPFMATAFALPDRIPEQGEIDLYRHYDRTRVFTFSALILGLLLFWLDLFHGSSLQWTYMLQTAPYIYVPAYAALIFIRARWFNVLVLLGVLISFGWATLPTVLSQ
jgi:hypothetical protein